MILHIDMDAFFASIEQVINPRLKGRPLIVGSRANRLHTVVCAASYEAKAYGIDSGMPSKEAFQICPDLAFVSAQQGRYIWTSEQIHQLLKGYGYQVCWVSIDEFQMDIRDNPDPQGLAQDIQNKIQKCFRITASIGIAKNSLLSKLASKINKPKGILILTEQNLDQVLAEITVEKLCGVGLKTGAFFAELGIKTCLELYQKSAQFLQHILGKNGINLWQALHLSERFQAQDSAERPKSIGHSYTFPRASENTAFIKAWIRLLSEMVARRLREQYLASGTVHVWLSGPEIGYFGAQKTFTQTFCDGHDVFQACLKISAKIGKKWPKIRALGVSCSNLQETCYEPLFEQQKKREELIKAVDQINTRHGDNTIFPAIITLTRKM